MANLNPRNVRPFWVEVEVPGTRTKTFGAGPKARDGEMFLTLYMRVDGDVRKVGTIHCYPTMRDTLEMELHFHGSQGIRITPENDPKAEWIGDRIDFIVESTP